jgi:hypothetical protein
MYIGHKHHIELVVPGEYLAIFFNAAEDSLHYISPLIQFFVVIPRLFSVAFRRNDRDHVQPDSHFTSLVSLIGFVHSQRDGLLTPTKTSDEFPSLGRVVFVAAGKREYYGRPIISGNQMNLGCPSSA